MDFSGLPYRPCVGIMLLNRDNLVWVGRRVERDNRSRRYDGGDWWQMPQGGVDAPESEEAAARRELLEETGIASEAVEVLGTTTDWLTYDLPEELIGKIWGGKYRGQKQRWFAMRFSGDDSAVDIGPREGVKPEFDAWRWAPAAELLDVVVPFKRDVYDAVLREFDPLLKRR